MEPEKEPPMIQSQKQIDQMVRDSFKRQKSHMIQEIKDQIKTDIMNGQFLQSSKDLFSDMNTHSKVSQSFNSPPS